MVSLRHTWTKLDSSTRNTFR